MIPYILFTFGLLITIWRIISSFRWTLETVKQRSKSVLRYRLSAYFEIFVLGVIYVGGSYYADMSRFWFIFGMVFIGLSLYSSSITLLALKFGKLESSNPSDKHLKRDIILKKVFRTLSHLILLCLWIYSWRHLFI
jgi:hypothetical protein